MMRTHTCGELRLADAGTDVVLCGWADVVRDHGGVLFVDLRDQSGIVQIVAHPDDAPDAFAVAERVRGEFVLRAAGRLRERPEGTLNPDLATGEVELVVDDLEVLSASEPAPFTLDESVETDEVIRLRHRPVDLRRPRMQANLRTRAAATLAIRQSMEANGFVDIETPTLIRSTPEGARDYLVPSRLAPGEVYALPQSPQLFKQLLMVGGCDRYYQVAHCWRDEDLRSERQPEFSQLDIEASFADEADVRGWIEAAVKAAFVAAGRGDEFGPEIPSMTWHEAMERFGTDKPDLRAGPPIVDLTELFAGTEFKAFGATVEAGGHVRAWRLPGGGDRTRNQLDALIERAKDFGAKGLVWMVVEDDSMLRAPITKFLSEDELSGIVAETSAEPGDLLLLAADAAPLVSEILGGLRVELASPGSHAPDAGIAPLWVTEFPMFEEADGEVTPLHHPFTAPHTGDVDKLESDPVAVRSRAYDLVINGIELGSGSVRIHDAGLQRRIFGLLGMDDSEITSRFGFLLEAFRFGVPPHAGFAMGIERLILILRDETSIREVMAFPKTQSGADPLTGAPTVAEAGQLADVGLELNATARTRLSELAAAQEVPEAGE